jgi:hypothetical protein
LAFEEEENPVIHLELMESMLIQEPYAMLARLRQIIEGQPEKFAVDIDVVRLTSANPYRQRDNSHDGKIPLKISTPKNAACNLPIIFFCRGETPQEVEFLSNDDRIQTILTNFKGESTFNPSLTLLTT